MERNKSLTEDLIRFSKKNGVDLIGFTHPDYFRNYDLRHQPEYYLKTTKTVLVIGIYLYDIILDTWSKDQNSGKSFHYLDSVLESRCHLIKDFLIKKEFKSTIIPYQPGLFLKEAAALAGIGPIGKNNLLLSHEFGPQVRLRGMLTDAPLEVGIPCRNSSYCDTCSKCVDACPVNALEDGKYNKEKCLKYNMDNLKYLSEFSKIWCNKCIEACPVGRQKESRVQGHFSD